MTKGIPEQNRIVAFEPYVPRWIRQQLVEDERAPTEPSLNQFDAGLVLADISGFTAFTERLSAQGERGAEQVQEVLDLCFGRLTDLIEEHGGEVLAFAGDAVLALWIPDSRGDFEQEMERSVRCAVAIRDRIDGLEAPGGFEVRLRVATAAGPAWAAVVGGVAGHWQLLVGGEPLNLIERTLSLASPGQVILSPAAASVTAASGSRLEGGFLRVGRIRGELAAPHRSRPSLPRTAEAGLRAFIPQTVQARIDAGLHEWLAEFRRVTVMFVNIQGVSDSAGGIRRLHDTTCAIQKAVNRTGGSVTQMLVDDKGTAALAAWGIAMHVHEDDAARAVVAGLSIERMLRDMRVDCVLGIATGRAWTGTRGDSRRTEFAIIGDVVNLAARLKEAIPAPGIVCDATTKLEACSRVEFDDLRTLTLKGKREPVPFSRPLRERSTADSTRILPLTGRTGQQRKLHARLEALAASRSGGLVVISGEPGLGKSHMISKLVEKAAAYDVRTELETGTAVPVSGAYGGFRYVFQRLLGIDSKTDESYHRQRVLAYFNGEPELIERAPLLRGILGIEWPDNELTGEFSAQPRAEATRELLVELFRRVTAPTPTLLVLDDAHWLDSSAWALAAALHAGVPELLLVMATRPLGRSAPGAAHRLLEEPDTERIVLDVLESSEIEALLCQRLGVDAIPATVAQLVHEKSEGNPFFAQELAYALRDRQLIEFRGRECSVRDDALSELDLPNTVEDVVTSRLDLLTPSQQLTLKVASVLGRNFELRILESVHPMAIEKTQMTGQLEETRRLGLVTELGAGAWEFKHAILQQVAYELLPFAQRRALHGAVADWHERDRQDLSPIYPLMAHHLSRAEDTPRALQYLELAGEQAFEDYANEEAIRFFGEALELDEENCGTARPSRRALGRRPVKDRIRRATWRRQLGEAHSNLGHFWTATENLELTVAELERPLPKSKLSWAAKGTLELARQLVRRTTGIGSRPRPAVPEGKLELVRALAVLGADYYVLDRLFPMVVTHVSALNRAEEIGPTKELAFAYADVGVVAGIVSAHRLARSYQLLAKETARVVNDPRTTARVLARTAIYSGMVADWNVEELEQSMNLAARVDDDLRWEESAIILSAHCYHRGEFKRCADLGKQVCERAKKSRTLLHLLWGTTIQAQCALHFGELERAVELCLSARERLDEDGGSDRDTAIKANGLLAGAYDRLGESTLAFESAAVAAAAIERFGNAGLGLFPGLASTTDFYLSKWESAAPAPVGIDLRERALWSCRQLRKHARRFFPAGPRALLFQGRANWVLGRRASALRTFHRALALAERLQQPHDVALTKLELSRRDKRSEARSETWAEEATRMLVELGDRDTLERCASTQHMGTIP